MNVFRGLTDEEIENTAKALTGRFGDGTTKLLDQARGAAKTAIEEAKRLDDGSAISDFETCRAEIGKATTALRSAGDATNALVVGFDVQADPPNAAAEYVHRALDLQVGKSGGLLAYNALGFTLTTLLWAKHARPEGLDAFRYVVVVLLFFSSLLCLTSILVRWPDDITIGSATLDLTSSIKLAHYRARLINAATCLAIGATFILVAWMALPEEAQKRDVIEAAVVPDSRIVAPIRLADTFHLRCTQSSQVSAKIRDWACSVVPEAVRILPPGK